MTMNKKNANKKVKMPVEQLLKDRRRQFVLSLLKMNARREEQDTSGLELIEEKVKVMRGELDSLISKLESHLRNMPS